MNTEDNHKVTAHFGNFMVLWSIYEGALDAGITKALRLSVEEGAIVTATLGHKSKTSILIALLVRDVSKNQPAIDCINKIENLASRNALVHGMVGINPDGLEFVKLELPNKLKAKRHKHTPATMTKLLQEMVAQINALSAHLGVTDEDRAALLKIGQSVAANKS